MSRPSDSTTALSSSTASESDSPLAGKARHLRLDVKDADISGDIGLFDVATEDEAASTEYTSADEDIMDMESPSQATESEPAYNDSDDSEWAPDGCNGSPKVAHEHDALDASSPELRTVKKARGSRVVTKLLASPLQNKSSTRSSKASKVEMREKHLSFDNLLDGTGNADDTTIIIPDKQTRNAALNHAGAPDAEHVPRSEEVDDIPKKKKR